ncbi:hypothetical protein D3C78_1517010 [compost metagenome]
MLRTGQNFRYGFVPFRGSNVNIHSHHAAADHQGMTDVIDIAGITDFYPFPFTKFFFNGQKVGQPLARMFQRR